MNWPFCIALIFSAIITDPILFHTFKLVCHLRFTFISNNLIFFLQYKHFYRCIALQWWVTYYLSYRCNHKYYCFWLFFWISVNSSSFRICAISVLCIFLILHKLLNWKWRIIREYAPCHLPVIQYQILYKSN